MCFSERTSWLTLLLGSAANAYVLSRLDPSSPEAAVVLLWWFALLMQVPEALEWRAVREGRAQGRGNARLALVLNLLQPVVAVVGLLIAGERIGGKSTSARIFNCFLEPSGHALPVVLLFAYCVCVAIHWPEMWVNARIRPAEAAVPSRVGVACNHMQLRWWQGKSIMLGLYMATFLALFACALPPKWAVAIGGYFTGTLLVSRGLYPCSTGSVWCWLVASGGLVVGATHAIVGPMRLA